MSDDGAGLVLFLGADGKLYAVQGVVNGNGPLPVTIVAGGGLLTPFDLEQIKGITVNTAGLAGGALGVGGTSASGVADDGSNPAKIGAVYQTNGTLAAVAAGSRVQLQTNAVGDLRALVTAHRTTAADARGATICAIMDDSANAGNWAPAPLWNVASVQNGTSTSLDFIKQLPGLALTGVGLQAAGLASVFNTTPPTYTNGQYGALQMTARGSLNTAITDPAITNAVASGAATLAVADAPTSASPAAIVPTATTVSVSSLTLKSGAGNLYGVNASMSVAGWIMIFDATAPPADGAVQPKKVYAVQANQSIDQSWPKPLRMTTGCTVVCSVTGPYLKTGSTTGFISGEIV